MDEGQEDNITKEELEDEEFNENAKEFFLGLLKKVFTKNSNINVLKIGIIQLSSLIVHYEEFTSHYLGILLSMTDKRLREVLSEDNIDDFKPIVRGWRSFTYIQTGAHLKWNSL